MIRPLPGPLRRPRAAAKLALLVGALALHGLSGCGDDGGRAAAQAPAKADSPRPDYSETTAGLEQQITDIFAAIEAGDGARLRVLVEALALDDPDDWFTAHFGPETGALLAAEYRPTLGHFDELIPVLERLHDREQSKVVVERFDDVEDRAAVGYQNLALRAMRRRTPLYSVRLARPGTSDVFHLWSFAYQGSRFRWVGKMRTVEATAAPAKKLDVLEYRLRDAETLTAGTDDEPTAAD